MKGEYGDMEGDMQGGMDYGHGMGGEKPAKAEGKPKPNDNMRMASNQSGVDRADAEPVPQPKAIR